MKTLTNLINEINAALSQYDAQIIESDVKSMKAANERILAVRAEQEVNPVRNEFKRYDQLFAAAGGKTTFRILQYGWNSSVEEAVRKSSISKIAARNAKIAAKLKKIDENAVVESGELIHTLDGFDGIFVVKAGDKVHKIIINTIFAGGYNIQCAHLRCLVKIK